MSTKIQLWVAARDFPAILQKIKIKETFPVSINPGIYNPGQFVQIIIDLDEWDITDIRTDPNTPKHGQTKEGTEVREAGVCYECTVTPKEHRIESTERRLDPAL